MSRIRNRDDPAGVDRRSLLTAAVASLGLAGCTMPGAREAAESTDPARTPAGGQQRVMVLGTTHLAYTEDGDGGNAFATDPGDVLGDERQRELDDLAARIAAWEPDRIAVEHPHSAQSRLETAYEAYRTGDLDAIPDGIDRRNEVVQIGCRLAAALDHETVTAVDSPQRLTALLEPDEREAAPASLAAMLPNPDDVAYPLPAIRETIAADQRRLSNGTLLEFHERLNRPERARLNDELLFAAALEESDLGEYTATKLLTAWYQRNVRIVANLWNAVPDDAERLVLLFGASHAPMLRDMLTTAPMFAPVSPLPYLES